MASRLSRRRLLKTGLGATAALAIPPAVLATLQGESAADVQRPNIILIMADDLGFECLSSYGSTSYLTPNLDRLGSEGVRFLNCFSAPVCTPTRVQLLTGQYPFRTGWTQLISKRPVEDRYVSPDLVNFANLLKGAGYATAIAGKWQLGYFHDHPDHPGELGFDEHCLWAWQYNNAHSSRYWAPHVWENGRLAPEYAQPEIFGPDIYCDYLVDFIERNQNVPFLAYYPMTLTHKPFIETPSNLGTTGLAENDPRLFKGMVEYMDLLVGRLMQTLERLDLREDTLIIFTGDNGTPDEVTSRLGNIPLKGGKGLTTDLGTHVPLIASWPGAAMQGLVSRDLVDLSDVLPTIAEACDVPSPAGIDGRSFLPELLGQDGDPRDWAFVQLHKDIAVREHRWKLHGDGRLYNLAKDPFERRPIRRIKNRANAAAAYDRLRNVLVELQTGINLNNVII